MTKQFEKMLLDVEIMVEWYMKRYRKQIEEKDDLIQEVRYRLLKYPPDLSKYKPTTCIMKAVFHTLYQRKRKELPVENLNEYVIDKYIVKIDERIDAREMLKSAQHRERNIIKLYFGIDYIPKTEGQIAKTMKVSNTLIGNLKRRGLQQIREKYATC